MDIKVILADDHTMLRNVLEKALVNQYKMNVIATVDNGRDAVALAQELSPDIMIMDINMPDLNGIEATRQIKEKVPTVQVIGLSMLEDRKYILGIIQAGASGYLFKDCEFEELVKAIQTVSNGEQYLTPRMNPVIVEEIERNKETGSPLKEVLSGKEREVLQLITEGYISKQVAAKMNISPKTVEKHRMNLMRKLGIYNLADLTKYAIRNGITELKE